MYYGWADVHALLGGFEEWEATGYPTEEKQIEVVQVTGKER